MAAEERERVRERNTLNFCEQCCALNLYLNSFKFCNKTLVHCCSQWAFIACFSSSAIEWSRWFASEPPYCRSQNTHNYILRAHKSTQPWPFPTHNATSPKGNLPIRLLPNFRRNSSICRWWTPWRMLCAFSEWNDCLANWSQVDIWLDCIRPHCKVTANCIQFAVCDPNTLEDDSNEPFHGTSFRL